MKEILTKYVKGCVMCSTCNPTNRKLGLYSPLPVPSHPWESISMDFVGGLSILKGGRYYLYIVVDRFNNMCILMPWKNKITIEQDDNLFFSMFGFTLCYLHPLSRIEIIDSLGSFGKACGE
jgi:hypothetical protein